jgi:hypothetical protein
LAQSGWIDAEFSPDVGELDLICETAIRHHRSELNQPSMPAAMGTLTAL